MKIFRFIIMTFITLSFLIIINILADKAGAATCSSISRSNVSANSVLTSTEYNASLNTAYTAINAQDLGCAVAGSLDDTATLNSTEFNALLNAIKEGCVVTASDSNTLSVDKCMLAVNGNYLKTTTATTVTWGCTSCTAEAASTIYYLYAKTGSEGTTLNLLISSTAPGTDGYDGSGNRAIAQFTNNASSNIDTVLNVVQGNKFEKNWIADGTIAGANVSAGTSAVTSYTGLTDTGLTLTKATNSIDVLIPCATTTAPTSTTCTAAAESIGIAAIIPQTGEVEVCAEFSHRMGLGATSSAAIAFQIVETPTNAQTITTEGKSRVEVFANNPSGGGVTTGSPFSLCGTFNVSSTGLKAFRLFYEQRVESGTISGSDVMADAGASNGQRDVHFTIKPVLN